MSEEINIKIKNINPPYEKSIKPICFPPYKIGPDNPEWIISITLSTYIPESELLLQILGQYKSYSKKSPLLNDFIFPNVFIPEGQIHSYPGYFSNPIYTKINNQKHEYNFIISSPLNKKNINTIVIGHHLVINSNTLNIKYALHQKKNLTIQKLCEINLNEEVRFLQQRNSKGTGPNTCKKFGCVINNKHLCLDGDRDRYKKYKENKTNKIKKSIKKI